MIINHTVELDFEPTPEQIAELFFSMDDTQMAAFFNALSYIDEYQFIMQMQYLTDNPVLTRKGRSVMSTIGEYSEQNT